jgi:Holliday junction DNA helicase RuvA
MIGFLRGKVLDKQAPMLLLDVNGVGYEVEATMATFYDMPEIGSEFFLFTHLVVREDAQLLYGFVSELERSLFRELIRVNGVGAKLALSILSGMSVTDFVRTVGARDAAALTRLPGVGKKTAERLIVDMADRLSERFGAHGPSKTVEGPRANMGAAIVNDPVADAVGALISLGYKPAEASRMIRGVAADYGHSSEALIKAALQASVA